MDQIRFDFLSSVNGGNSRSNANANTAESGEAFAQILDQQLARRADAGTSRRSVDSRGRSDAGDRAEGPRPHVVKRRDDKSRTSPPTVTRSDTPAARPEPKAKQPEKTAVQSDTCAKPSGQPQDETDKTAGAAAGGQATTESDDSGAATETEGRSDGSGETPQQQGDEAQQQASDGTEPAKTGTAETDLDLLAMLAIPLPLQTIAVEGDAAAETDVLTGGGDAAAAALQAELAARLTESIDLTAAVNGKAEIQGNPDGLKFGAILNAGTGTAQKGSTDPLATLQAAAEELAKTGEPLPAPGSIKLRDTAAATPSKARDAAADNAASTVNPEQNGKTAAAIVQPMNRAAPVTWSGTNLRNELSESMVMQAGSFAADDAEFSNWSQVLGSGASGLSNQLAARQSAFLAQLKQNLQNLPAHEQIAVQIKSAMQNGNSRLTVALHPVELGRVEVKLDIDKDKKVTATIVVERPATLDLLRNDAKALERALQDAGLQTDSGSLSFNLRDSHGQNGDGSQNGMGTGGGSGQGTGGSESEVKAEVRADVIATADGYVDLET